MKSGGIILLIFGSVAVAMCLPGILNRNPIVTLITLLIFGAVITKGVWLIRKAKKVETREVEQQGEVARGRRTMNLIQNQIIIDYCRRKR